MYTKEDLSFILFNNRSVTGVVKNFLPNNINVIKLISLEENLKKIKSMYNTTNLIEVDYRELDLNTDDILVKKEELVNLKGLVNELAGIFNESEYEYLINRGIGEQTILNYKLFGLSSIENKEHLKVLGATTHPIMKKFIEDGLSGGGIVIPLFEGDELVNCAIRKISIENNKKSKTLKYSLACPDIPVWGLDNINSGDEIWLTEGIFDMIAINKMGKKAVSCSSAMWSGIQLYKILDKKPKGITIVADNDNVGLRTASILRDLFDYYLIPTRIVVSKFAKDAAEHYFQKMRNLDDFIEIEITDDIFIEHKEETFDFINHLKTREF
jgi:hypothetical protein